jgi:Zn-dependent alcohol dehydrogenase
VVAQAGSAPEVVDIELAELRADEILVRPVVAGICHSDVGWAEGTVYDRFPVILGHEVAGVVEAIGSGVTDSRPGQRVAIALAHHCGHCAYCESGHPILCAGRTEGRARITTDGLSVHQGFGTGGFAELMVVRASSAVPIPHGVPFEVAATAGCATSTGLGSVLNLARMQAGSTVAVLGAGAVGLCVVMGCVLAGAERIVVSDPSPERRAAALSLGATEVVDANEDAVRTKLADGYEYVFESAGTIPAMELAVRLTARGGTTTLLGVTSPGTTVAIDAHSVVTGQRRILGSLTGDVRPHRDFDRFFRLYLRGRLPLDRLITGSVPFADIAQGFSDSAARAGVKTIVHITDDQLTVGATL